MDGERPARRIVLVEGLSDAGAVHALAARGGHDLAAEGIAVTPMGGATNIGRYLARFGPPGLGVPVAGLCDAGEEPDFRRGLERAGLGSDLAQAGFFVCVADLEDELIRATGEAAMTRLIEVQEDSKPWRAFRRQQAWHGRPVDQQMHRFIRSVSERNGRYIRAMVEAMDPSVLPRPLRLLLGYVQPG